MGEFRDKVLDELCEINWATAGDVERNSLADAIAALHNAALAEAKETERHAVEKRAREEVARAINSENPIHSDLEIFDALSLRVGFLNYATKTGFVKIQLAEAVKPWREALADAHELIDDFSLPRSISMTQRDRADAWRRRSPLLIEARAARALLAPKPCGTCHGAGELAFPVYDGTAQHRVEPCPDCGKERT